MQYRVVLVARAPLLCEATAPQRRIDLGDSRTPARNIPAIERPEMDAGPEPLADIAQPGNAGMGGFRYRPLHVEMEYGFRAAGVFLGHRRQRALPMRAAPLPAAPSRTKST